MRPDHEKEEGKGILAKNKWDSNKEEYARILQMKEINFRKCEVRNF